MDSIASHLRRIQGIIVSDLILYIVYIRETKGANWMKKMCLALGLALLMMITTVTTSVTPTLASIVPGSYTRIAGQDRFDTAKAIAMEGDTIGLKDVIIVSGNNFPDALSVSVLAKKLNAPILLVDSTVAHSSAALTFISDKLSKTGTIHIIGGTGIISDAFKTELNRLGFYNIDRIGGYDRYDTNTLIAQELVASKNTPIVIASGESFPDAISISSIASSYGYPILLTAKDSLPQGTKSYISSVQPSKVYIVGGTGVVSDAVQTSINALTSATITRLAGTDRFDTSEKILSEFSLTPKTVYIASGIDFPDALAGSTLASVTGDPIVLVDPSIAGVPPAIMKYLQTLYSTGVGPNIVAFGGTGVIPDIVLDSVGGIIMGDYGDLVGKETKNPSLYNNITVINEPIVDVFKSTNTNSERVTQALYAQQVRIIAETSGWSKVEVKDGYIGWIESSKITKNFTSITPETIIIESEFKDVYSSMNGTAPITKLTLGTELYLIKKTDNWYEVALPMNAIGWIETTDTLRLQAGVHIPKTTGVDFVNTAKKFLGVTYLWGGVGGWGIDCSGLTYISSRVNGVDLPRDAQPQYDAIPTSIAPTITDMLPGDLVFFSKYIGSNAITHVGIYIGDNQFIQALGSESTVITSLSSDYFKQRIVGVKRVFVN